MRVSSYIYPLLALPLLLLGCQEPSVTEPAQGANPFANQAEDSAGQAPQAPNADGEAGPAGAPGAPSADSAPASADSKDITQLPEPAKSESGRMIVDRPRMNERVGNLIKVEGTALVYENRVHVQVLDASGDMVKEAYADAKAEDIGESGPFEVDLDLSELEAGAITLAVMGHSAKDGSAEHKVVIPLEYGLLTAQ